MKDRRKITEGEIRRFRAERPVWDGAPDGVMVGTFEFSVWLVADRCGRGVGEALTKGLHRLTRREGK